MLASKSSSSLTFAAGFLLLLPFGVPIEARFFAGLLSSSDEAACLGRLLEVRALGFTSSSLLSSINKGKSDLVID